MQTQQKITNNEPANVSESDAITNTIQAYVNGGKSGRGDDMKPAFHPDATIFGYIGSDLLSGPIQQLFDWNDRNGPATELQAQISGIDIMGTIATARLELDNWTGRKFTDMFTLLKTDGEWKIISKVFYLHPES
ncbi:MAG: nuclear transport factor 2 family protein [Pyrinomonadaceae bacterium]